MIIRDVTVGKLKFLYKQLWSPQVYHLVAIYNKRVDIKDILNSSIEHRARKALLWRIMNGSFVEVEK